MSGLGAAQTKLTSLDKKTKNVFDPDALSGANILPHNAQYEDQQRQDQNARNLAAQQTADAAAASTGPQNVALRDSLLPPPDDAAGVTGTGGMQGTSLMNRTARRAASRALVSG